MAPDPATLAAIALAIMLAYTVFGLTGFGAAMVAVPVLIQAVPLAFAVPLVVVLDLVCTSLIGGRHWRLVDRQELRRLMPGLLIGVLVGTQTLAGLPPKWPLIMLGVFVIAVALRNAWPRQREQPPLSPAWVWPFALIGGVFSALFGTGGPIYTLYLSRRLADLERLRATVAVVILTSGLSRALSFAAAGLYAQPAMLTSLALALPFCLAGFWLGARLRHRVAPHVLKRGMFLLLALGGAGAIHRGLVS